MDRLTDKQYWDGTYLNHKVQEPLSIVGIRKYCNRLILCKLQEIEFAGKHILELGAGDSQWLPHLAKTFPAARCVGVDYSETGCALLRRRAAMERLDIEVIKQDMFVEYSALHSSFDVVISFGVVEHFGDLSQVLSAQKRYLKPGGIIFAEIPNMAGLMGALAQRWNREVYKRHNPHDLSSFLVGHERAGLEVLSSGYLGSTNFGVLSACFPADSSHGISQYFSRMLTASSYVSWAIESLIGHFPASKIFSPYIYAISRPS